MLAVLYLISHLDGANIGNAKILGLTEDLGLSGIQYDIALSLFFIPYVLLEVPSNILLKRFSRPSVYLGTLIVTWGIIMTLTGVVQNFGGLLTMRILLGIFEAGFFPGSMYLCSLWYMPRELGTRIASFCASALSGAFPVSSRPGSARWMVLAGRWLDQDEIRYLEIQHFVKEGGQFKEKYDKTTLKDFWGVMKNWRLYLAAYIMLCQSACNYGSVPLCQEPNFTLPTVTKAMGFQDIDVQLMAVPPYIAGAIAAITFCNISDRHNWRFPFVAPPPAPNHNWLRYNNRPERPVRSTTSWAINNLALSKRRAIGSAFNICMGNAGGIIGSYMYLDRESPTYLTGFGLSLAFGLSGLVMATILELSLVWANKRNGRISETEVRERHSDEELLVLGDRSPL
ncbi:major facilitator superfamily domain-containing protein [Aspergillus granulosus]|uniref:Major facilitator superfamily domain-containing protein n=1 Tax=Aspergillus granulosus TaxID=176169 RepID=A0ABR4GUX1_9EURO